MKAVHRLIALLTLAIPGAYGNLRQSEFPRAPELVGSTWLNTKDGKAVTLESRRGHPTLVAFWTFACENCQNNLAPYARLLARYRPKGVEMLSVHTPEIQVERNLDAVQRHVKQFKIDYPVVTDNDGRNWNRWGVQAWPSLFVIDAQGHVRYHWFGELNYQGAGGEAKVASILDALLAESTR